MGVPNPDQLFQHVVESHDVVELETRVSQMHGVEYVAAAKLAAVRLKGAEWVFGKQPHNNPAPDSPLVAFFRQPANAVASILIGAFLGAILFPPRVLHLPDGLTIHTGFSFLFSSANSRNMGAVNVALLALELATILVVGLLGLFLARRFSAVHAAQ